MMIGVESIFLPLESGSTPEEILRLQCDSQSLNYYAELSKYLCSFILGHETLSLLDVGPRTGAGLALLRLLHHPQAFTRLKLAPVTGIDLDPSFERIAKREFTDIIPMTGDIFDLSAKSFDIVTCSHTIEHIEDAEGFVKQLMLLGRRTLIIACPFEEKNRVPGHIRSINRDFFDALKFDDVTVYESQHWHNGLCCMAYKNLAV